MTAAKRLVVIVPDSGDGGLFQFYNQLVPELVRHVDVHVIFASPYHSRNVPSIAGATCHFLPAESAIQARKKLVTGPLAMAPEVAQSLAVARLAWDAALALEPDCVEVCDWPLSFVPAVLDQSIPYVIQCHGSLGQIAEHDPQPGQGLTPLLVQLMEPQLLAAAHCVQTYSESNASTWTSKARRTVQMIRPAFAMSGLPQNLGEASDKAVVLGRLQRWKGPHVLCQALQRLGPRSPAVDWYGGVKPWGKQGRTADEFLHGAYPDIWDRKFHHLPAVPRSTAASIQARALFNIVPSTWDVFNFTAVESMAASRPTIVSTGAGASELVVNGENGFAFDNEDPESLAAAMDCLLSMPERRRQEIGMAGRETIRLELDPARIAEQRLAAYQETIGAFRTRPPQRPDPWITEVLDPTSDQMLRSDDLLSALPLRTIGRHLGHRLLRKVVRSGETN